MISIVHPNVGVEVGVAIVSVRWVVEANRGQKIFSDRKNSNMFNKGMIQWRNVLELRY